MYTNCISLELHSPKTGGGPPSKCNQYSVVYVYVYYDERSMFKGTQENFVRYIRLKKVNVNFRRSMYPI